MQVVGFTAGKPHNVEISFPVPPPGFELKTPALQSKMVTTTSTCC